jgi:hypothetical protein
MPGPSFQTDSGSAPAEPNPATDLDIDPATLDQEVGSVFDWVNWPTGTWIDRDDNGYERVIDMPGRAYSIKINKMLSQDGQANQVFEALMLPLVGATAAIPTPDDDDGQAAFVRNNLMQPGSSGGMDTPWSTFVAQMAGACAFKRSYFEKVFTKGTDGKIKYKKLAWRPPGSCELVRDIKSGEIAGFRQYMSFGLHQSPMSAQAAKQLSKDGYMEIPMNRACVYVHGQRRDPIDGISSLDPAYWAYVLKQRVLQLWFTFLDVNALPKVLAYGRDGTEATKNAANIARLRGSGVVPVTRPDDPSLKVFETLNTSGSGAGEYHAMIGYLDQAMTHSVLAGFLDLTRQASGQAGSGGARGSNALNQGSMDLFLESRATVAKEMADCINTQVIAPLVALNFGPDATVPQLTFEKITSDEADRAIALLTSLATAPTIQVPSGFVDMLVEQAAQFLNLDQDKVAAMIEDNLKTFPPPQSAAAAGGQSPAQLAAEPMRNVAAATDTIGHLISQAQGGA